MAMDSIVDEDQWWARYRATTEALQRIDARGLKVLTDEEAQAIITSLCVCEASWCERPEWLGLVIQQAIFRRWYKK
jgi:hypothetical protein